MTPNCNPGDADPKTVLVVGCARNVASTLPRVMANIEALDGSLRVLRCVIVENGSTDGTKEWLERWAAADPRHKVVSLDDEIGHLERRTERLAVARNRCLAEIRAVGVEDAGTLIVADLDSVNAEPWDLGALRRACAFLHARASTAGVFAVQKGRYYDVWALRHAKWCPSDCWRQVDCYSRLLGKCRAQKIFVHSRQRAIATGAAPIRVRSAFGGLALYKTSFAMQAFYVGVENNGRQICEHVAFNERICRLGGELYIFPELMNLPPTEHITQDDEPHRLHPWEHYLRQGVDWLERQLFTAMD